ncbi:hypothetical protein [Pseudoxanthomonas sp. Root630]|uniref:hypothetical protein n=1 Tax=Pseudoxanthomonas sp. Root630 TaxID=1736574 RepID=UPI0012DD37D6|nr:hypothetical protein [Pseudoxanthomonas sp. Root630]
MESKKVYEAGVALHIAFYERRTASGSAYFQARASFRSTQAPCTIHIATREAHQTLESAELAIVRIARKQGWV